eukprot:13454339-Alexandrium_andersonii.AAC.1
MAGRARHRHHTMLTTVAMMARSRAGSSAVPKRALRGAHSAPLLALSANTAKAELQALLQSLAPRAYDDGDG